MRILSRSGLLRIVVSALVLSVTLSCASTSRRTKGAVIGGAAGGVVGGLIGKHAGSTAKGAIVGAVIGGAAGAIIGHQMDMLAKELKQNIPGASVERVGEGIKVTFASGLLFDFNSAIIRGNARSNLDALAQNLDKYDDSNLMIVGHTDNVGSEAYNLDLSERRADAATRYLVVQGVARSRIGTLGVGESEPVASNDTEEGRSQNRRIEVAIYASEAWRRQAMREVGPG
jgi:outer membrane protein OmpA-like peptidoglycan-associated protein